MGVKVKEKIKGSGVWWVFINHSSRRTSKRVGSEKAARKVAEMIEARLKLGQAFSPDDPQPSTPTLDEYYQKFKIAYMDTALRFSTRSSYERSFRVHVLPELGNLRLDAIDRQKIQEFISTLLKKNQTRIAPTEKKLSKDSIRLALAALSVLFSHAKENGIVRDNPVTGLGKFYRQAGKLHEIQPLTAEEVPPVFTGRDRVLLSALPDLPVCDPERLRAYSGGI